MPIRPRKSHPVGDTALTPSVRDLEETYHDAGTRSAPPSLVTKATMEAAHKKVRSYLDHQQRYQELEVAGDEHIASIWPQEELLETADDDHVASIGPQEELPEEVWEEHIRPLNPTVCLRDLELKKSSSSSRGQIDRRYRLQEDERPGTQRQA
ncbi:hypothetical protein E4U49_006499 [Claviceps purpurea]|nr:hypothetical protein E4U49_006499 [Claviceps purpurea]